MSSDGNQCCLGRKVCYRASSWFLYKRKSTFLLVRNAEKLKGKISKHFLLFEVGNEIIDLNRRLDASWVEVRSHSLVFVGNFIVIADKLPLSIRLNVDSEAGILKIWFKVIDGGFNNASSRVEISQVIGLAGVTFLVYWHNSFLLVRDQNVLKNVVDFLTILLLLVGFDVLFTYFLEEAFAYHFRDVDVSNSSRVMLVINLQDPSFDIRIPIDEISQLI